MRRYFLTLTKSVVFQTNLYRYLITFRTTKSILFKCRTLLVDLYEVYEYICYVNMYLLRPQGLHNFLENRVGTGNRQQNLKQCRKNLALIINKELFC